MRKSKFSLSIYFIFMFFIIGNGQQRFQDTDRQIERFNFAKSFFFNYDLYTFTTEHIDSFQVFISVSLVNDLLQFVKISDSQYKAKFEITLSILNEDEYLKSKIFRKEIFTRDFKSTNSQSIGHSYYHAFFLKQGKYKLLIEVADMDTKKSMKREQDFELPNLSEKTMTLFKPIMLSRLAINSIIPEAFDEAEASYANLPANILNDSTVILSPFKINEIEQYRIASPFIVYHEIYKETSDDSLNVKYRIIDNGNKIHWEKASEIFEPDKNKISRTIKIDPKKYKPGSYTFQILASYQQKTQSVQVPIYFNSQNRNTSAEYSPNNFTKIDEIGPLQYVFEKKEYQYLNSLPLDERETAIDEFWEERNPSGELRKEFIRRIVFSNQNFISLVQNKKGWQTDQGRIYIIFGPADEILHPQSPNSQFQHEIWIYAKLNPNRRFIFVFKPEVGEYVLLRSE